MTGIVLAGGGSRRFGEADKALATVDGEPMLARAVSAVREATDGTPVVAVNDGKREGRYREVLGDVEFVHDDLEYVGPLAGVAAAVPATEAPWLFVCGCDMPLVSPAAVRWLREQREEQSEAVVPVVDGEPQSLHAWYRRDAVADALDRIGEPSLRALLSELDCQRVDAVDAPADVPLARSVTNVNTREELRAL